MRIQCGIFYILLLTVLSNDVLSSSEINEEKIRRRGDNLMLAVPSIALLGSLLVEKDLEGSKQILKSIIYTQIATELMKETLKKDRPNGNCCSFPSGHASAAFSGAGFIHKRYGFSYALPAYIASGYVAWSRVYSKKHFSLDVLAGAALGTYIGFKVATPYKKSRIEPFVSRDAVGIQLSGKW